MTSRSFRTALGSGVAEAGAPRLRHGARALREAVASLAEPVIVVAKDGHPAVAEGGSAQLGTTPREGALPLLAHVPALSPASLGDAGFRNAHGVTYAYVAGEMANGIASEALVEAVARAGMLGIFGAAGLPVARIEQAMERLERSLAALPWGVNLIHSPDDPALEAGAVELFLKRGLRLVSASAYLDLTLPIVKYRLAGIHRGTDGRVVVPNRVMAKVSRVEVARKFFEPAPERFVQELVRTGFLTAEQAALAATVPMADDVTAEADSGGHTDNRPLVLLLPALQSLRDEVSSKWQYPVWPRVGAAGGLATPASVASAFAMGASYVVTGSVNQACREAGTSEAVRDMLAQASPTDVAMAPAADMFELGVKVQVLSRGTMFAVRAQRLYDLYRSHDSVEALPAAVRAELEEKYFRCSLEQAWAGCETFFAARDPRQLERAAKEPKHRLALLFRSYLGQASHWANDGVADRRLDYQVWCGPAMGAFNAWAKGSFLEAPSARGAVVVAKNLLVGAAVLTRAAALRAQGFDVPAEVTQFGPLTEAEIDALLMRFTPPASTVAVAPGAASTTATFPAPVDEPIAIVGMGSLFPKAENLTAFWRLLRTGLDAVTDVPASHWAVGEYHDADPHAPDTTYARRGAFLSAFGFDPTEFGIPPSILEATDTSQLLGLVVAKMAMEDAGYGDHVTWDRSRASVLLGVTGTQELVISLGARLGHPKWEKALDEAGVDEQTAQGDHRAHFAVVRPGGKRTPFLGCWATWWRAASRTGSTSAARIASSTRRARVHWAPFTSRCSNCVPSAATWCSPVASTASTTFSCTCVSARRRRCRPRATCGRSLKMPTARCWAKAWACWCSSACQTPNATKTASTRRFVASARRAMGARRAFTRRCPRARRGRCGQPTNRRGCGHVTSRCSKPTAPARRPETPPNSKRSIACTEKIRTTPRGARSARSNRKLGTRKPRRAPWAP